MLNNVVSIIRAAGGALERAGNGGASLGLIQARLVARCGVAVTYQLIQETLRAGVVAGVLESCDAGARFCVAENAPSLV